MKKIQNNTNVYYYVFGGTNVCMYVCISLLLALILIC